MSSFDRSIGPQADLKELEYIVALQQTCPGYTRSSGTISSLDILRFLKSRYSLQLTHSQASDIILGLSGGSSIPTSNNIKLGLIDIVQTKYQQEKEQAKKDLKRQRELEQQLKELQLKQKQNQQQGIKFRQHQKQQQQKSKKEQWKNSTKSSPKNEIENSNEIYLENYNDNENENENNEVELQEEGRIATNNISSLSRATAAFTTSAATTTLALSSTVATSMTNALVSSSTSMIMMGSNNRVDKYPVIRSLQQKRLKTTGENENYKNNKHDDADENEEEDDDEEEDEYMTLLLEEMMSPKMVYLDLVQTTSILLIPTIARFATNWKNQNATNTNIMYMKNINQADTSHHQDNQQEYSIWNNKNKDANHADINITSITNGDNNNNNNNHDNNIVQKEKEEYGNFGEGEQAYNEKDNNDNNDKDHHKMEKDEANDSMLASIEVALADFNDQFCGKGDNDSGNIAASAAAIPEATTTTSTTAAGIEQRNRQDTSTRTITPISPWAVAMTTGDDLSPKPDGLLEFVLHRMHRQLRQQQQQQTETQPTAAATTNTNTTENDSDNDMDNVRDNPNVSTSSLRFSSLLSSSSPPKITNEMVKSLLLLHGDHERANDEVLIQQMVDIAKEGAKLSQNRKNHNNNNNDDYVFDMPALVHALSADILHDWKVGCEDETSTCIQDVFHTTRLENFTRLEENENDDNDNDNLILLVNDNPNNNNNMNNDDISNNNIMMTSTTEMSVAGATVATATTKRGIVMKKRRDTTTTTNNNNNNNNNNNTNTIQEGNAFETKSSIVSLSDDNNLSTEINLTSTLDIDEVETTTELDAFVIDEERKKEDEEDRTNQVFIQSISGNAIDTVVDTFGSSIIALFVWITYFCHSFTYSSLILSTEAFTYECVEASFGCTLFKTILSWLTIAVLLSCFGIIVMVPLSAGNNPNRRNPVRLLFATVATLLVTTVPFGVVRYYQEYMIDEPYVGPENIATESGYNTILYLGLLLGIVIATYYFIILIISIGRKYGIYGFDFDSNSNGILGKLWTTSDEMGTTKMKHAATRKINTILTNARRMHGIVLDNDNNNNGNNTSTAGAPKNARAKAATTTNGGGNLSEKLQVSQGDATFQNFVLHGEQRVSCGNIFWTWQNLLNGEIFTHEGIWFPARLWIFQLAQLALGTILSIAMFIFIERVAKEADRASGTLPEGLPQWVYDIVPTGSEVKIALIPAAIIGTIVMAWVACLYLPSTASTILQFRCGNIPTLGSPSFEVLRTSVDAAHMNTANAVYGMFAAGGLFFVLIGLVIFLFIWRFSRNLMLFILAWGIGLTITTVLKMVITTFCRKRFYRGFYRLHPGRANFSILALECWFIGLGGGVLIGRITQFLLASAFWIGRIDEPFLADNVSLFGYKFDYVPLNYGKEILLHEAHRHPFIERLGTMYLMRLRHKGFGSNAGGCWRQLFVLTLMPWMVKYRVHYEQRCIESIQDQEAELAQKMEEEATFSENGVQVGTNIVGVGTTGAQFVTDTGLGALGGAEYVTKAGLNAGVDTIVGAVDTGTDLGKSVVDMGANLGKATVDTGVNLGKATVDTGVNLGKATVETGTHIRKATADTGVLIGKGAMEGVDYVVNQVVAK